MKNTMNRRFVSSYDSATGTRTEVLGMAFGVTSGHIHTTSGSPEGSHIAGGRFVVDSPLYILDEFGVAGSRQHRSIILPDVTGAHLKRNDKSTDFSGVISASLDSDGLFRFIGVTVNGSGTCKYECDTRPCCPIGYEDIAQYNNYHPLMGDNVDIVTQGYVTVYTESPVSITDDLHVRVKVMDDSVSPCQLIGGVTAIPDDGTQPIGSNVRIEATAAAGEALLIELGGMNKI